ncbi:putative stress activated map kinase interacting protein [Phaeomoniella chlamydospora]|uniref:Putative stress activated map kinase interacting protein n=1 Tax=Phaeomoniella chlamydospora TaxID=158046 RepID=A0A0G2H541_PHACM|nr:putative stress activated map kinase interacting protein [Phaeomoniella chlamydospora]
MSLLQNEDFVIWYLRNSYLNNIKDGVGERLITLNSSVLNTAGFRAAGWSTNASEIKRTYSPPIPTVLTSEYFQAPKQGRQTPASFGEDDDEEGGMVTGGHSNDTVAPAPALRRRRRKDTMEEEDSSDLSDDSEDDADSNKMSQQIKFAKMPPRNRSGSSPVPEEPRDDGDEQSQDAPKVNVISPSRRSTDGRLHSSSFADPRRVRARGDTITSSDFSSDNDFDVSVFQRREVGSRIRPTITNTSSDYADDIVSNRGTQQDEDLEDESGEGSVGSALSSEFGDTAEAGSLLDNVGGVAGMPDSSPVMTSGNLHSSSPKKTRAAPLLQALPVQRPISMISPVSLLSAALRSQKQSPANPLEKFQGLSGKGSPNPLYIKIYAPFSNKPEAPFEVLLNRQNKEGVNVTVGEATGFALWRYSEEDIQPSVEPQDLNVNSWVLRMVEDGEVEYDFPALGRVRPMMDFTNNNVRGARGRSRDRPWDEFALVKANSREKAENEKLTPQFGGSSEDQPTPTVPKIAQPALPPSAPVAKSHGGLGQPFPSALNYSSVTPADQPMSTASSATPRVGVTKTLKVRYMDLALSTQVTTVEIGTDSYIAEILDHVCKRWNLDKAGFVLKVSGTNTVAPLDRTVEALGNWSDLDLVRRRFYGGPYSLTGSPGSSSPNAPLLVDIEGPKKGKKNPSLANLMSSGSGYKRYAVIRKQPMSFSQANPRIVTFDGDYIHIIPAETTKTLYNTNPKSTSILFSNILGCKVSRKHPKSFKLVVRRGSESKRYDFEAKDALEAQEIVDEVQKMTTNM